MTTTLAGPGMALVVETLGDKLESLRARLAGALITPESVVYDDARKVQNVTIDRKPLAIVAAANAYDVAAAVNFARDNAVPLVVRSGGHSLAGHSMIDGALVVDLSSMRQINIEGVTRVARVGAGTRSGDLAGPANQHGLALTTGDTASVGFGGLATGGGIGYMVRKYGLTIDSLLAAQVVTASGEIVTASRESHPDLFWAIRGGGGNFGIITEFTFQLAKVDEFLGGDLLLPATREVVRGYLEYSSTAPDELSTLANIQLAPPAPFVPEEWVGKPVLAIIVAWAGDVEAGQRAVDNFRALATPVADTVRPMPYPDIYLSTKHQEMRHGLAMRSMFADELSDETIDAYIEAVENISSPYSIIHLRGLGGQLARVPDNATAFAHRQRRYLSAIIAIWLDPEEDPEPHQAWTESLWERTRHEGNGVYVNFLSHDGPERLLDAYPRETLARLAGIKRLYDPENLFRFNQNIQAGP